MDVTISDHYDAVGLLMQCYQLHTISEKSMAYLVGIDLGKFIAKSGRVSRRWDGHRKTIRRQCASYPSSGWSEYDPQEAGSGSSAACNLPGLC